MECASGDVWSRRSVERLVFLRRPLLELPALPTLVVLLERRRGEGMLVAKRATERSTPQKIGRSRNLWRRAEHHQHCGFSLRRAAKGSILISPLRSPVKMFGHMFGNYRN